MAQTVLLIFITLINLLLWFVFFIRFKKTFSPEIMLRDIKNEVNKLLIEINRTVDRDIALIENRIRDLKVLMQETDRRMSFLYKERDERFREEKVLKKLSFQAAADAKTKQAVRKYKEIQNSDEDDKGVQLAIDFDSYRNIEEPQILPAPPEPPLKERVIKLYTDGLSVETISKQLQLTITEVQFIIDLFLR